MSKEVELDLLDEWANAGCVSGALSDERYESGYVDEADNEDERTALESLGVMMFHDSWEPTSHRGEAITISISLPPEIAGCGSRVIPLRSLVEQWIEDSFDWANREKAEAFVADLRKLADYAESRIPISDE